MKCLIKDNGDIVDSTSQEQINKIIDAYNVKRIQRYVTVKEVIIGLGGHTILMDMGKCGWRKKQKRLPEVTHEVAIDMKFIKGDSDAEKELYKRDHLEISLLNITDLEIKPLSEGGRG